MSKKEKRVRRSFNEDFKRSAVDLVVKQGYSCNRNVAFLPDTL
jgi:transposase-like protein